MNKTNNTQTRKDANKQEHKNKETWKTVTCKSTQTKRGTNEQEHKKKEKCWQTKEQDQKPTQKHNAQNPQNTIYKLFFYYNQLWRKKLIYNLKSSHCLTTPCKP
jgi:hypothetical protein